MINIKYLKYIICFLVLINLSFLTSSEFDRLIKHFVAIDKFEDVLIIYGSDGTICYSLNNGKTWETKVFQIKDYINDVVYEDSWIDIFFHNGKIIKYNIVDDLTSYYDVEYPIIQVEKINNDYFILSESKLIKLNKEFNIIKKKNLKDDYSKKPFSESDLLSWGNKHNPKLNIFNNNLYLIEQNSIVKFNSELVKLDSMFTDNFQDCNNCSLLYFKSNTSKLLVLASENYYDISDFAQAKRLFNLNNPLVFSEDTPVSSIIKIIDNEIYSINFNPAYFYFNLFKYQDSKFNLIGRVDIPKLRIGIFPDIFFKDFLVVQDDVIIVDRHNFLYKYNIPNKEYSELSNLKKIDLNKDLPPIEMDNGIIFYPGFDKILISDNNYFLQPTNMDTLFYDSKYELKYQKYDEVSNILFRIYGEIGNFDNSWLLYYDFNQNKSNILKLNQMSFSQTSNISDIDFNNNQFIVSHNARAFNYFTRLFIYDQNFEHKETRLDSVFTIDFISTNKKGEYLIVSSDSTSISANNLTHIKKSFDLNGDWEIIKSYEFGTDTIVSSDGSKSLFIYSNLIGYKDIVNNSTRYLMLTSYNRETKEYVIELMDYVNYEFTEIYNAKYETLPANAHTVYKDTNYISINDTLFTINDIFDKETWTHHKLPNNGKILYRLSRVKDRFFVRYSDDIREFGYYWLSLESGVSSVEKYVEVLPYTYVDNPFPNPVLNGEVTFDVYVSGNAELKKENIRIYDINGTLVSKESDINLSTGNNWPASVRWECSSQQSGVYFAIIDANGIEKLVKIIVQ